MESQDKESILEVISALSKRLEDIQKLEFVQVLGLYYCTESSNAMLDVVKQALKVKDFKFSSSQTAEKAISFLLSYLDEAIQARTLLLDITGERELEQVIKSDNRLEEKISIFIKAIPSFLAGLEIIKKSDAYVKSIVKKAADFINKKEGITGLSASKFDAADNEDFDSLTVIYGEKDLKYFIGDLMNYLQVLKMQSEEKGIKRNSTILDEMKKFELNSRKVKLIGYYGERVNDKKEGPGKYYYLNGNIYDGEWKEDKKHGYGVIKLHNKDRYEGTWKEDKMHGKGVYYYADNSKYQGDWYEDKKDGYGVFSFADGSEYEGEWRNDQMHGKGVFTYKNGAKFTGEWKNGQINGRGTLQFKNGYLLDEEWRDGVKKRDYLRMPK